MNYRDSNCSDIIVSEGERVFKERGSHRKYSFTRHTPDRGEGVARTEIFLRCDRSQTNKKLRIF